jgi:hypothetical protein
MFLAANRTFDVDRNARRGTEIRLTDIDSRQYGNASLGTTNNNDDHFLIFAVLFGVCLAITT